MKPQHALVVTLLLMGACDARHEVPDLPDPSAALVPNRSQHEFGLVQIDSGQVETVFRIVNESPADVRLLSVSTSCGCTEATAVFADGSTVGSFDLPAGGDGAGAGRLVASGERFEVRVVFDPAAHGPDGLGELMREVTLATLAKGQTRLVITANVVRG